MSACPICDRPSVARFRPFCSRRCADVDLGRWFSGSYAVPAVDPPDEEELAAAVERDDDGDDRLPSP